MNRIEDERIINVNVTESDFEAIVKLSAKEDRSIRGYVRNLLKEAIARARKKV